VEQVTEYRDEFEAVQARLDGEGIDYELRELVRGKPAGEDLVTLAAEVDADLIVIGLRRRSPVGKLVLGSNAQDILLQRTARSSRSRPSEAAPSYPIRPAGGWDTFASTGIRGKVVP
jgi:hypothetical protein